MANTFTADFREIWSKVQQDQFFKETVAVAIADTSVKSQMKDGDTFNKPYRSSNSIQTYTRGTLISIDEKTDTNEQLVVNKQFATGFYVDTLDEIQSNYDLIAAYAKDDSDLLNIQIDADVLGEATNATSTVDDGDIGGTSGNGITLSTSNVLSVFSVAREKIAKQNVAVKNLFAVISPEVESVLIQYGAGRDTSMGDSANMNGYFGTFQGFKLYTSNNLTGSAVLSIATDFTATDTVVIDGITFTAQTTIGTAAGNFLVGSTADTSRAVLTAFINDPSTTSSDQVALSTANARRVARNWTAVNDNDADTMTVTAKGVGRLVCSETLNDTTDGFVTGKEIQHNLFGVKGSITLVVQRPTGAKIKDVETKLGYNILNAVLYGIKTFAEGAKRLVDVKINSAAFSAGASNI